MDVTFTPAAQEFIRRMMRFSGGGSEAGFRMTVTPGGCSGYSTQFSVEERPAPGDETVSVEGVKVFLPAISRISLDGATVDFCDNVLESGFTIHNPNAASCGCSTSGGGGGSPSVTKVSVGSIGRRTETKGAP